MQLAWVPVITALKAANIPARVIVLYLVLLIAER